MSYTYRTWRARLLAGAAVTALTLVGLEALPRPALADVPVAEVETVGVEPDAGVAAGSDGAAPAATDELAPFELVGVSWMGDPAAEVDVEVELQQGGSKAFTADTDLSGPDGDRPEGEQAEGRTYSQPVWVESGGAVTVTSPPGVTDVQVHVVREHTERRLVTDGPPTAGAHSAGAAPAFNSRSAWNARPRNGVAEYASSAALVLVHHTVNANDYAAGDVPAMLRAIQAYHMDANGWDDIGYNFVVDRFGAIWEARSGGADRPVIGAHATGFNSSSVGIAVLGDFSSVSPPAVAVDAVGRIAGWKLALAGGDPLGSATVTASTQSRPTPYPPGTVVTLPSISGHKDVGFTSCPGLLYNRLATVRNVAATAYPNVFGNLESARNAVGGIRVTGWAIDRTTTAAIEVHAYVDGAFAGFMHAAISRPDVGAAYPEAGRNHGFNFVAGAGPGTHEVCVYGINVPAGFNYSIGCRSVFVGASPFGNLEAVNVGPASVTFDGWTIDPDTTAPLEMHVYIDGSYAGLDWASVARADIGASYPDYGAGHGFNITKALSYGTHDVCIYAINQGQGVHVQLGCRRVTLSASPIGNLDAITPYGGYVVADGWALDQDTTAALELHFYVDGAYAGLDWASVPRADVGAAWPRYGPRHGFNAAAAAAPGTRNVCVYAINQGAGVHSLLGCRSVRVT